MGQKPGSTEPSERISSFFIRLSFFCSVYTLAVYGVGQKRTTLKTL